MNSVVKIDRNVLINRLGWMPAVALAPDDTPPVARFTAGYLGVYSELDLSGVEDPILVVNRRLSIPLDCTIAPSAGFNGSQMYHAFIAISPALFEVAEVSAPTIVLPGAARTRIVVHIRALKKFDLRELHNAASIHLID